MRKDPANKDNLLKLADMYRRDGRLEDAEQNLLKALELSGGNMNIREVLEDVQLDLMAKAVTVAKEQFRANPTDETRNSRPSRWRPSTSTARSRSSPCVPNGIRRICGMKFELATRYMKQQKWQAAIPLLQQARSDPRVKGESLINLGKCFGYDKKPQLARRQFEAAIPEVNHEDSTRALQGSLLLARTIVRRDARQVGSRGELPEGAGSRLQLPRRREAARQAASGRGPRLGRRRRVAPPAFRSRIVCRGDRPRVVFRARPLPKATIRANAGRNLPPSNIRLAPLGGFRPRRRSGAPGGVAFHLPAGCL